MPEYDPNNPKEAKIGKNGENLEEGVLTAEEAAKLFDAPEPKADDPKPEPKKEEKKDEPEEIEITEEEIATLRAKKPEELTAEEQAFLAEIDAAANPEPDPEEPTYTVGGVEMKRSELVKELSEQTGIDYSGAKPEAIDKLVSIYLDSKNKEAWQKSLTLKSQGAAEQNRRNQEALVTIRTERTAAESTLKEINEQIKRLEQFAADSVTEADTVDNVANFRKYTRKLDAEEALPDLKNRKAELETKVGKLAESQTMTEISLFQSVNPQYQMKESFTEVLRKYDAGEDHPDSDSLLDIVDVVRHAQTIGKSLEVAYKDLAKTGRLRVKPQASQPIIPKPKSNTLSLAEKISARQKNPTAFLKVSGSKPPIKTDAPKKPLGDVMTAASRKALGVSSSKALDEAGY